jgi:putative colanic acid biosynthesis UDP-glucose lipid carrier transferase
VTRTTGNFEPQVLHAWFIATPLLQYGLHRLSPFIVARSPLGGRQASCVIVGAGPLGRELARAISLDPFEIVRIAAYFDDRNNERLGCEDEEDGTVTPLGRLSDVARYVQDHQIQRIYIALPMASQPRILALLDALRDTTASIYFAPDIFVHDLIQARVETIGGMPVVAVCESPFFGTEAFVKRLSDIVLAVIAIVLTTPIMLGVAIAVATTSPGPILFRQRRYGLDGREIEVWKFRSMRTQEDGAVIRQATREDARITNVGRWIRKTSLDELPQFFNVLQGRMSVVGPRPHAVAHNEMFRSLIKGYMVRHKVKPGITGWAQVNGARGETATVDAMSRRIDLDLAYLRNWSLNLDLRILWGTVRLMVRDPNAY